MKLLYLVIDGVADKAEYKTSLEAAHTPNLDYIAERGICGLMYTMGRGVAPESDVAVFSILGYNPHHYYTGRGPLEALGVGLDFREEYEVAFRANFATVDPETLEILDRRAGRSLESMEARELARSLDGLVLDGGEGYVRVVHTIGHRAVVIIGSRNRRLSDNVSNTDPAYVKVGKVSTAKKLEGKVRVEECKPLDGSSESKYTARLVNEFTRRSVEILAGHPINLDRVKRGLPPANAIILRDPGMKIPKPPKFHERYGLKLAAIAQMPVEIGIFKVLGLKPVFLATNSDKSYEKIVEECTKTLSGEEFDGIYVHVKGPDEPGHDGDFEGKVRVIEEIDREIVGPLLDKLDLPNITLLVTSDHATPYTSKRHTDDPVPVALYSPNIMSDNVRKFDEKECRKGSLGIVEVGWELLPRVLELVKVG